MVRLVVRGLIGIRMCERVVIGMKQLEEDSRSVRDIYAQAAHCHVPVLRAVFDKLNNGIVIAHCYILNVMFSYHMS